MLKEIGIAHIALCNFCDLERDSLQDCMWGCEHMKSFWNELERFICQNCENVHNLKFNEKIILFGTSINFKSDNILYFIILSEFFFQSVVADMKKSNHNYEC